MPCVYCGEHKDESDFNKEHIIPEALGLFGTETMTLKKVVCCECNTKFSRTFEQSATRDSLLLSYRLALGLSVNPLKSTLKHKRKHSSLAIQSAEGIYHEIILHELNGNRYATRVDSLTVKPPQAPPIKIK